MDEPTSREPRAVQPVPDPSAADAVTLIDLGVLAADPNPTDPTDPTGPEDTT